MNRIEIFTAEDFYREFGGPDSEKTPIPSGDDTIEIVLMNDIDCSEIVIDYWMPRRTAYLFNGQGNHIKNLTIEGELTSIFQYRSNNEYFLFYCVDSHSTTSYFKNVIFNNLRIYLYGLYTTYYLTVLACRYYKNIFFKGNCYVEIDGPSLFVLVSGRGGVSSSSITQTPRQYEKREWYYRNLGISGTYINNTGYIYLIDNETTLCNCYISVNIEISPEYSSVSTRGSFINIDTNITPTGTYGDVCEHIYIFDTTILVDMRGTQSASAPYYYAPFEGIRNARAIIYSYFDIACYEKQEETAIFVGSIYNNFDSSYNYSVPIFSCYDTGLNSYSGQYLEETNLSDLLNPLQDYSKFEITPISKKDLKNPMYPKVFLVNPRDNEEWWTLPLDDPDIGSFFIPVRAQDSAGTSILFLHDCELHSISCVYMAPSTGTLYNRNVGINAVLTNSTYVTNVVETDEIVIFGGTHTGFYAEQQSLNAGETHEHLFNIVDEDELPSTIKIKRGQILTIRQPGPSSSYYAATQYRYMPDGSTAETIPKIINEIFWNNTINSATGSVTTALAVKLNLTYDGIWIEEENEFPYIFGIDRPELVLNRLFIKKKDENTLKNGRLYCYQETGVPAEADPKKIKLYGKNSKDKELKIDDTIFNT